MSQDSTKNKNKKTKKQKTKKQKQKQKQKNCSWTGLWTLGLDTKKAKSILIYGLGNKLDIHLKIKLIS